MGGGSSRGKGGRGRRTEGGRGRVGEKEVAHPLFTQTHRVTRESGAGFQLETPIIIHQLGERTTLSTAPYSVHIELNTLSLIQTDLTVIDAISRDTHSALLSLER